MPPPDNASSPMHPAHPAPPMRGSADAPSGEYTPFRHPVSLEEFRAHAHDMVELMCSYYETLLKDGGDGSDEKAQGEPEGEEKEGEGRRRAAETPMRVDSVLSSVSPGYLEKSLAEAAAEDGSSISPPPGGSDNLGKGGNLVGKPGPIPKAQSAAPSVLLPPMHGEPLHRILDDFKRHILPGVTHWQHPQFFAFFSANSSFPAILGDMLSSALNVIGFNWVTSPACTELETIVMDWLTHILRLPNPFRSTGKGGGVIQGSASESVLVSVLAAKDKALGGRTLDGDGPYSVSDHSTKLVVYCSDQTHSSVQKAALIAGIHHVRVIPTHHERCVDSGSNGSDGDGIREGMYGSIRVDLLEESIVRDAEAGLLPCFLVATLGTTATTSMDPVYSMSRMVERLKNRSEGCGSIDMWMHVDAAFSGSQLILPQERRRLLLLPKKDKDTGRDADYADMDEEEMMNRVLAGVSSFTFNPHKWLLTNFDCSAYFVRDRSLIVNALSITPSYLRNRHSDSGAVIDYRDWQVPLGRRFRSLKLWMVIRSYGVEGLQKYIMHHLELTQRMEQWIRDDPRFELVAPRTSALLVFRMTPPTEQHQYSAEELDNMQRKIIQIVNAKGDIYITGSDVPNIGHVLRVAICGTFTELKHVKRCWTILCDTADKVIEQC